MALLPYKWRSARAAPCLHWQSADLCPCSAGKDVLTARDAQIPVGTPAPCEASQPAVSEGPTALHPYGVMRHAVPLPDERRRRCHPC